MGIDSLDKDSIPRSILAYLGLEDIPDRRGVTTKGGKLSQEGVRMLILFGDLNQWLYHANMGETSEDIRFNDLIQDIFASVITPGFEGSLSEGLELETFNWVVTRLKREKVTHITKVIQASIENL